MVARLNAERTSLLNKAILEAREAHDRAASIALIKTRTFSHDAGDNGAAFPSVDALSPTDGDTGADTGANIVSVLFDEDVIVGDNIGDITVISAGDSGVACTPEVTGDTGVTLAIKNGLLVADTVYNVVVPAGAVKSADYGLGNEEITWQFKTNA